MFNFFSFLLLIQFSFSFSFAFLYRVSFLQMSAISTHLLEIKTVNGFPWILFLPISLLCGDSILSIFFYSCRWGSNQQNKTFELPRFNNDLSQRSFFPSYSYIFNTRCNKDFIAALFLKSPCKAALMPCHHIKLKSCRIVKGYGVRTLAALTEYRFCISMLKRFYFSNRSKECWNFISTLLGTPADQRYVPPRISYILRSHPLPQILLYINIIKGVSFTGR